VPIAIWFFIASNFAEKRVEARDFPARFQTTKNQIAVKAVALKELFDMPKISSVSHVKKDNLLQRTK
jgi:hypothetical protein